MRASCRLTRLGSPPPVITMMGRSDQGGWHSSADAMLCISFSPSASSLMTAAAVPTFISLATWAAVAQTWLDTLTSLRAEEMRSASRPLGARINTRESWLLERVIVSTLAIHFAALLNQYVGNAGQHPLEVIQWIANDNPMVQAKFSNGPFMVAAALLDHGNRLPHLSFGLEETKQKNRVGEIADVHGS